VYPTISVLIPLRNAEKTASRMLSDVLDIVGDLHSSFEVLLVDDGSMDDTSQVIFDLARRYPQVRAISSARPRGFVEAVQVGLELLTGDFVFVQDGAAAPAASAYRKLWQIRQGRARHARSPLAWGRSKGTHGWNVSSLEGSRSLVLSAGVDVPSGLQLIRRNGVHPIRAAATEATRLRHWRQDVGAPPAVPTTSLGQDLPSVPAALSPS